MNRENVTKNNAINDIRITAYENTRNLCLIILDSNGKPMLELSLKANDFFPPNLMVADIRFVPEKVKDFVESNGLGVEIDKYYQDGIEYPLYEMDMAKLKELSLSDYADYLSIRSKCFGGWLTKEEIAEKMAHVRSNIIKEKYSRANKLASKSLLI